MRKDIIKHTAVKTLPARYADDSVVSAGAESSHRNHCPNCLSSLHLDIKPGDRESDCGGIMDTIGVWVRKNDEWEIIHRCRRCGEL